MRKRKLIMLVAKTDLMETYRFDVIPTGEPFFMGIAYNSTEDIKKYIGSCSVSFHFYHVFQRLFE